jgi:hypothetical protein
MTMRTTALCGVLLATCTYVSAAAAAPRGPSPRVIRAKQRAAKRSFERFVRSNPNAKIGDKGLKLVENELRHERGVSTVKAHLVGAMSTGTWAAANGAITVTTLAAQDKPLWGIAFGLATTTPLMAAAAVDVARSFGKTRHDIRAGVVIDAANNGIAVPKPVAAAFHDVSVARIARLEASIQRTASALSQAKSGTNGRRVSKLEGKLSDLRGSREYEKKIEAALSKLMR